MMKRYLLGAAAALAIAASPASAATLINGGFEGGTFTQPYVTLSSANSTYDDIYGWEVTGGTVEWIGSYWQPHTGSKSLDLNGTSPGTISQNIADTVGGQSYAISFYASKNPDAGAPTRTGTISFGGQTQTFTYALSNTLANMSWQLYTFYFTASGANTLLSFSGNATTGGCCWGPALDDVSIAAVPEPEIWAMLLFGLGAVGWQMRRRNRLQVVTA
ncbi:choice-of-anchor C family protein [Sphingomonas lutea]|uniref:Choice-of-anchor C family protein n=1 Tax=Sphingomonas lutea TaxID=1045317 RepID=A0A7G9SLC0_9SPHN|nr:choice-of-anchor C family protein [Sphingomonas lutea]QNN68645.1 choice-of-anchor C family protein [Sphingomonas lutea]